MSHQENSLPSSMQQLVASLPPISASSVLSQILPPAPATPCLPHYRHRHHQHQHQHQHRLLHYQNNPHNPVTFPHPRQLPLPNQAPLSVERPLTAYFLKTQSLSLPHPTIRPLPTPAGHARPSPSSAPLFSKPPSLGEPRKANKPLASDAIDGTKILFTMKVETEEEIAAWIAARKKNWPTAKNVENKVKDGGGDGAKFAKAGISSGQKGKRKSEKQEGARQQQAGKRQKLTTEESLFLNITKNPVAAKESKAAPVTALSAIAAYKSSSEESEEEIVDNVDKDNKGEGLEKEDEEKYQEEEAEAEGVWDKGPNTFTDDDEEKEAEDSGDEPEETQAKPGQGRSADREKPIGEKAARLCKYFARGRCRRGKNCEFSHEKRVPPQRKAAPRKSLLAKLLDKDIKTRNEVLLQCLSYIAQHNFFLK